MDDLLFYSLYVEQRMQTLGILLGKDASVDGCWLGVVEGVHIEGVNGKYLQCRLDVLIDDDGLDRLREYTMIEHIMGDNNGNKGINTDD